MCMEAYVLSRSALTNVASRVSLLCGRKSDECVCRSVFIPFALIVFLFCFFFSFFSGIVPVCNTRIISIVLAKMWSISAAAFVLVVLMGLLSVCITTLLMLFGHGIDRQNKRRGSPHTSSHQEFLLNHVHAGVEESGLIERPRPNGEIVRLFYRFWLPKDLDSAKDAKAVVVALHGVNSHSARNNKFMIEVLQHGFVVAGMDHEGMGRSDGRHGYFSSVHTLVDDAIAFVDLVKAKHPRKKVFLFGA
jgi:hypothetical protein